MVVFFLIFSSCIHDYSQFDVDDNILSKIMNVCGSKRNRDICKLTIEMNAEWFVDVVPWVHTKICDTISIKQIKISLMLASNVHNMYSGICVHKLMQNVVLHLHIQHLNSRRADLLLSLDICHTEQLVKPECVYRGWIFVFSFSKNEYHTEH